MQATVLPMVKSIRIKYVDDKELKAVLDALSKIPGRIKVNGYTG
jgi:hypothetical protein